MIRLPPREARVVVHYITTGKSPREVGQELGLAASSVSKYLELASHRIPGPQKPMVRLALWVYGVVPGNTTTSR